jgi:hypothetical protein
MDLQKTDLNDYAMPLMSIERMAKQIHDLCLENKFDEARQQAQLLCVEGRVLQHVLTIMHEQESERYGNSQANPSRQAGVLDQPAPQTASTLHGW